MKKTKKQDEYYFAGTYKSGNVIAKIYRPILTEEERERRMERIRQSAAKLLESSISRKKYRD